MKRCAIVALPLALGACSLNRPVEHLVIDQNTLLARTTDEVMLANLLRAKNNEPMHFSMVQAFHGSASLTAGLTLGATFPGNGVSQNVAQFVQPSATANNTTTTTTTLSPGVNALSPQASGSYTITPSFDSTIIDSQSFFQGFLSPIDPDSIGHFLYDNWPPELLTYLLVGRYQLVAGHDYDTDGNVIDADAPKGDGKKAADKPKVLFKAGDVVGYLDNTIFAREQEPGASPIRRSNTNPFLDAIRHFKLGGVGATAQKPTPLFPVQHVTTIAGVEKIDGNTFDMADGMVTRIDGGSARLILSRYNGGSVDEGNFLISGRTRVSGSPRQLPFVMIGAVRDGADEEHDTCDRIYSSQKAWQCATYIPVDRILTHEEAKGLGKAEDKATLIALPVRVDGVKKTIAMRLIVEPVVRSPESVFFFVGQYLRNLEEMADRNQVPDSDAETFLVRQDSPDQGCLNAHANPDKQPMMVVTTTRPARALLSAELDGTRYYIPDPRVACTGQSMKVLTLLEQLFYLQVSASDKLGLTPTVHIAP